MTEIEKIKLQKEIEFLDLQIRITWWFLPTFTLGLLLFGDIYYNDSKIFRMNCDLNTYLQVTSEIISAILGLAIPISLTVIEMIQSRFETPKLTKSFVTEPLYLVQIALLFTNIALLVSYSFFEMNKFWAAISIAVFALTMILFYYFIRLVHQYVTQLEKLMSDKYRKKMIKYFE